MLNGARLMSIKRKNNYDNNNAPFNESFAVI